MSRTGHGRPKGERTSRARRMGAHWSITLGLAAALGALSPLSAPRAQDEMQEDEARQEKLMQLYDRMIQFNLKSAQALPEKEIDARMAELAALPVGEKIAAWANDFWTRGITVYRFGPNPGGYVAEGRLVDDFRTDCVLFVYRVTELGRSSSALEAVQFAFGTRFYGASLEDVVDAEGRVDYSNPVHLKFAEEMIRSGIWGHDVTDSVATGLAVEADPTLSPAGELRYAPIAKLDLAKLKDGDVAFFVTDERTDVGATVRKSGTVIGHLGIIKIEGGQPQLLHAASSGITGLYDGGKVEKVALATYLARVGSFKGVIVTRVEGF
jgi:hypothetical protein